MNPVEQAMMHELLDRQGASELIPADLARLQDLLDVYGRLMVRKAHAYLLLARRGYRVPMQEDLRYPFSTHTVSSLFTTWPARA